MTKSFLILFVVTCGVAVADDYTIVAFGDSTTVSDFDVPVTYADILRNELSQYGITGTVSNKGVSGNTTRNALARFGDDVLAQHPNLVIIQFGINDSAVDVWKDPPPTGSRIPLDTFVSNLRTMTRQLKDKGARPILMTSNPVRWSDELRGLYGKPPYDVDDPMGFNVVLEKYAEAVRELAAAEQVDLVDVYQLFVDYENRPRKSMDELVWDGMHPNPAGHGLIADTLLELIKSPAVLTEQDLDAGREPNVGDAVLLSDFTRCYPRAAVGSENVKGKWWIRPYKTADGEQGDMLCVEQRDMDNPKSCLVPALTYPAQLDGIYDIWVGTYIPLNGGGIDIKLTRDKVYSPVDPAEDGIRHWPPEERIGKLIECFYKTADMTGQNIHLRQTHGTYQSYWWGLCNAHVDYIKLIRRSPREIERAAAERSGMQRKGVIVDRDGFSYIWWWGENNLDCLLQQLQSLSHGNAEALNLCVSEREYTNFPHPMAQGSTASGHGQRLGDLRAKRVAAYFEENQIDLLQVMVERCHELGLKIFASQRSGSGKDYGDAEEKKFWREFLLYIPRHYDIDGITLDFTRHPPFFQGELTEQEQFDHLNAYVRQLRADLDEIGRKMGKRFELNASFECGVQYRGFRSPESWGLDVQTWVDEEIFDRIMPEGRETSKYIAMCQGKKTRCYPKKSAGMDFDGSILQSDHPGDPTPADDKTDRWREVERTPLEMLQAFVNWYDEGADGVFLFNTEPDMWNSLTTFRNLQYPEIIRREVAAGKPFGRRVGEKILWLKQ